ncbi:hypothetical protein [Spirosoma sp. KNUC1025]|uniref:hypothetical protein n=1 Tax=Spirosoma sp. KNUC1025 TaxID=2894082 RepID=UPI0038696013|nr:hypothetical protein LN737_26930 [Spirosoma sp. KNUC1025]
MPAKKYFFFILLLTHLVRAQKVVPPTLFADPVNALQAYHENLAQLRQEHTNHRELPDLKFYFFGMGDRLKLIYRNGRLLNALTGNIEEQWNVKQEVIVPSEYLVHLTLADGQTVQIREDELGVWLLQTNKRPKLIPGTRSRINLPRFADKSFGPVLRVLHQEVLINVINGRPVPNFLVYYKPWYRDAAMMAMVLRTTNNLHLIRDWILAIRDPFDRNNRLEADNFGEVLFLVSLVSDKTHPVVPIVLDSLKKFRKGNYILGKTDNIEHPVYQTKWLKYGLKSLGLPDTFVIPKLADSYSSVFWLDYKNEHVDEKKTMKTSAIILFSAGQRTISTSWGMYRRSAAWWATSIIR